MCVLVVGSTTWLIPPPAIVDSVHLNAHVVANVKAEQQGRRDCVQAQYETIVPTLKTP